MIQAGGREIRLMNWYAEHNGMVKVYIPDSGRDWAGLIWSGNGTVVPSGAPACGWDGDLCDAEEATVDVLMIFEIGGPCLLLIVCGIVLYMIRGYRYEAMLKDIGDINVNWHDVKMTTLTDTYNNQVDAATYKDNSVFITKLTNMSIDLQNRNILVGIKQMKELSHENISPFIGICTVAPNTCILMAYALRGSLRDVIETTDIHLDMDFKTFLALDIVIGMRYLHQSDIGWHGRLTSTKCVVDNRWTCKITGHGLRHVRYQTDKHPEASLWTSPEVLRNPTSEGTKAVDVFSFGIIIQELMLESVPYSANHPTLQTSDIIENVTKRLFTPYRPVLPFHECPKNWANLAQMCWLEDPQCRPTFSEILKVIRQNYQGNTLHLADSMIQRMEKHTYELENQVAEQTQNLLSEKNKMEMLLSHLLPQRVVDNLMKGNSVQPEIFENVTIFFSDIVGFTNIASHARLPMDIIHLLNSMYTMFDDIAQQFDVYKVATIGDAYMVASGVPIRNGNKHATEVCSMALALLEIIKDFPIPHMAGKYLHLRIGIHSGPCVAGVVGIKMPRYFLFGNTVDIAAKMESSGEPMKIHVSETTINLVQMSDEFVLRQRGEFHFKGNDKLQTYWLCGSM